MHLAGERVATVANQMHPARHAQYANGAGSRFIGCFLVVRLASEERAHLFIVGECACAVFTHTCAKDHPRVALQRRKPLIEQQGEGHAYVVRWRRTDCGCRLGEGGVGLVEHGQTP